MSQTDLQSREILIKSLSESHAEILSLKNALIDSRNLIGKFDIKKIKFFL